MDKYNNQVDKVETEIGKLPPLPENAYFSGLVREYDSVVKLKDEFSKSGGGRVQPYRGERFCMARWLLWECGVGYVLARWEFVGTNEETN